MNKLQFSNKIKLIMTKYITNNYTFSHFHLYKKIKIKIIKKKKNKVLSKYINIMHCVNRCMR